MASNGEPREGDRIELFNLKTESMNKKKGVVESTESVPKDGRLQIKLDGEERTISVKRANVRVIAIPSSAGLLSSSTTDSTGGSSKKVQRPAAMTGRPGAFRLGYDWREVLPDQILPAGLEVMASFEEGVPTIARIPRKWKLDVFKHGHQEVHVRMDVERKTSIQQVVEAFAKEQKVTTEGGWDLLINGKIWGGSKDDTVESASLFNNKCELRLAEGR